jgi:hypothetical protein
MERDMGEPSALTLAAMAGHADVVRLLVEKWPAAGTDEAYMVARLLGHASVVRYFAGGSRLVSSGPISKLARNGNIDDLGEIVLEDGFTKHGLRFLAEHKDGVTCFGQLIGKGLVTREQAELFLTQKGFQGIPSEILQRFRSLGVRASRSLRSCRVDLGVAPLTSLFGPVAEWDVDPYDLCPAEEWAELVRVNAPLKWSRYADGAERLEILSRLEDRCLHQRVPKWVTDCFFKALRGQGIDLSRHC